MRVLFVLENYHPFIGGAEVLFKNVCEGLASRGHSVTVITTLLPGTEKKEVLNGVKIRRVVTPARASRYWFTFLAIPLSITLAGQADIIHTTTYNGALPALIAAMVMRKKRIITVHEIIGKRWKEMPGMGAVSALLHRLMEIIIVRLPFDRYIAVSRFTADCLDKLNVNIRKIQVIYNGIDYNLFNPQRVDGILIRELLNVQDNYVYLYYGRPGISKGVEFLIEAASLIANKTRNARLLMLLAREPVEGYTRVIKRINELQLQEHVIMIDPVPRNELPSYIAAADCVVVPSLSEGFGFSAVEACAMGVPVVASNVASLPEVISGKHVLVEPGNPRAIALGVEAVYNNDASYTERKVFKWSDCIDQYEKLDCRLSGVAEGDGR